MTEISSCCEMMNPCEALCMLKVAEIKLTMGETITSYKVGGESYTFARPSLKAIDSLIKKYEGECNMAQGKPARRRAKWCFVHADPTCGRCGQTNNCRCR